MSINRHITHWFRGYAADFPFCEGCRSLPDYMEISDDSPEVFPPEVSNLQHAMELNLPYICDGSFMFCEQCHFYYWYRSFAPGGSEDAMRTVNYETISKSGLLWVEMELREALEFSSKEFKKYKPGESLYSIYHDDFQKLKKGAEIHRAWVKEHAQILIKDAIVCLKSHASSKDNEYYVGDLLPAEVDAAKLLVSFLKDMPDAKAFRKDLKKLTKHPNPGVAEVISAVV